MLKYRFHFHQRTWLLNLRDTSTRRACEKQFQGSLIVCLLALKYGFLFRAQIVITKEAKEIVFNPDPVYTTEYIIIMEVKYAEWEILNQVLNWHVLVLAENTAWKLFFSERKQSVGGKHRPKNYSFQRESSKQYIFLAVFLSYGPLKLPSKCLRNS